MASGGPFDIGDEIVLSADFTDENGNPANPVTVTLKILDPAGATTTFTTFTQPLTGRYEHSLVITMSGRWHYRFEGVGGVTQAEEHDFSVRQSVFA